MGVLTILAFASGAVIGYLFVTSHVMGYFGIITGVVDCGSIDNPEWGDMCAQVNSTVRMLIPFIVPVVTGAVLASVVRLVPWR